MAFGDANCAVSDVATSGCGYHYAENFCKRLNGDGKIMATITLQQLSKIYDNNVRAVSDIDIDISDGEFVVIVGPSGCGKSTLLRMVAGLESISAGALLIDGERVNELEPKDRGIAMVFQNYALYPHMTNRANMGYGLKIAGMSKAEIKQRVEKVAEQLQLTPFLERKPAQLSGGQRQRVAMGRAIVREPKVFLFDEPLSNLDAKLRVEMRKQIKTLQRELNITSLYVTHDQVEAMTMADRLIVLKDGMVQQIGAPMSLYEQPQNRFVAEFIGSPAMNLIEDVSLNEAQVVIHDHLCVEKPADLDYQGQAALGIRPEDITLALEQTEHSLPFTIEMIEHLGASCLLHGRLAGSQQEMMVQSNLSQHWQEGQAVYLHFPKQRLHFFSMTDGQRIGK